MWTGVDVMWPHTSHCVWGIWKNCWKALFPSGDEEILIWNWEIKRKWSSSAVLAAPQKKTHHVRKAILPKDLSEQVSFCASLSVNNLQFTFEEQTRLGRKKICSDANGNSHAERFRAEHTHTHTLTQQKLSAVVLLTCSWAGVYSAWSAWRCKPIGFFFWMCSPLCVWVWRPVMAKSVLDSVHVVTHGRKAGWPLLCLEQVHSSTREPTFEFTWSPR